MHLGLNLLESIGDVRSSIGQDLFFLVFEWKDNDLVGVWPSESAADVLSPVKHRGDQIG